MPYDGVRESLAAVHGHAVGLARWLAARLAALRHSNGAPVVRLYGDWCTELAAAVAAGRAPAAAAAAGHADHGPTVAFNLLRADGSWVGYAEVSRGRCF